MHKIIIAVRNAVILCPKNLFACFFFIFLCLDCVLWCSVPFRKKSIFYPYHKLKVPSMVEIDGAKNVSN